MYGVLELASFHYLEKYEIDFIEKVCESFAATISNFRNDTLNTMLIKDHEMLSKQLKEKESEIARINELLKAGQEEVFRVRMEASEKESWLSKAAAFLEINSDGLIISSNTSAERLFGYAQGLNRVPFGELFLNNEEYKRVWQQMLKEGESEDIVSLINRDFRKISVRIAMSTRLNGTSYIAIIQDLTPIKQYFYQTFQQQLKQTEPKPQTPITNDNDESTTNHDGSSLVVGENVPNPHQAPTD